MANSNTFFHAGGFRVEIARCEDCGADALFINWPAGWTQCGGSKYGTQFQPDSLAWHCPTCQIAAHLSSD